MSASAARGEILPMTMPPNLTKSGVCVPEPMTMSRSACKPAGARKSSTAPSLPVNFSALAARATRSWFRPSSLLVAAPSRSSPFMNTTKTPLVGVANAANAILGASAINGPFGRMAVIGGTSVLHYSIIPRLARQRAVVLPSTRFTPAQRRHRTSGVGAGPDESSQKCPNWQ